MKHRIRVELSINDVQDYRVMPGFGVQEVLDFVEQDKPVKDLLTTSDISAFTTKVNVILDEALTKLIAEYEKLK